MYQPYRRLDQAHQPVVAAPHENAVVIGTGVDDQNPLKSIDNSVVLGARSNKPSIVISQGAANQAGSVAIGQDTTTGAAATRAVVIGSGAGPGVADQLINQNANSVVLGALRHADIFGHRVQLADPARGARGGGELVGRIGLDHDDVAGIPGLRQIIGDRRADDAAADDHDLSQVALTDIGFMGGSAEYHGFGQGDNFRVVAL